MTHRQRHKGSGTLYRRCGRGPFIARWFDHSGRRREASTRCTDRAAAERILAKKVADAALRRDGVVDARDDGYAAAERKPLAAHVDDWIATLAAKRVTDQQLTALRSRVTSVFESVCVDRLSRITASAVQAGIGEIHRAGKSLQTCQHYLRAIKQFSRWMHRDGRAREDVLAHLQGFNAATDRRYERRAFTTEELIALFSAAEIGPSWRGLTGHDRAVLYRVAAGTGFRAGELASLTPPDFELDVSAPRIVLPASKSKRRREDSQPIRRDLALTLLAYFGERYAGGPVWPGGWHKKAAAMLRFDLRRARVAYIRGTTDRNERRARRDDDCLREVDAAGRVADFHALRATYITILVQSGVSPKVAQTLARHSTPVLTLGVYAKLGMHDLSGALESLAPLDVQAAFRATGTDGPVAQSDKKNTAYSPDSWSANQFGVVRSRAERTTTRERIGTIKNRKRSMRKTRECDLTRALTERNGKGGIRTPGGG